MRNVAAGPAELDMFDAQKENRLKGQDLRAARGVAGLFVEYEERAYRFNVVIGGVRRALSGLHVVSINVEDPFDASEKGEAMKLKAWKGMVAGGDLIRSPFVDIDDMPPKSAHFYTPEDVEAVMAAEGELDQDDKRRFYELEAEQARQKPLQWTAGDIIAPNYAAAVSGPMFYVAVSAGGAEGQPSS